MKFNVLTLTATVGILGMSGLALADSGPLNLGGPALISAYAKRQVLKLGMETTIIEHASGINGGNIELFDENTHTYLAGDRLGGGSVGFVVANSSPGIVTYKPVVLASGIIPIQAGPAISVEWQAEANSTSNGYAAPNGGGANANFYTTPANATAPMESTTIKTYRISQSGYNSEAFAEDYGGPVLENWTDLSNGATTSPSYHWTVPTDHKPMFYQMTAYAVPVSNGSYNYSEQAKVYSPTYVANEPANQSGIPELATIGTNLTLKGLSNGEAIWFTYVGMNTQDLKWQTVAADSKGVAVIPLNRLGAIKILDNGVNYINVDSANQTVSQ